MTTFTATNVSGPTGTIQTYTVPDTGSYFIRAYGAQGGGPNGGLGAMESGVFNLTAGEVIHVLVGQRPLGDTGGGGGTFVVKQTGNVPLLIAGGGGGSSPGFPRAAFMDGQAAVPPLTDSDGRRGENNGSFGGTGGNGGTSAGVPDLAACGGGLLTDGASATNGAGGDIASTEGKAYVNGGEGGTWVSSGGYGGGGGGGSHVAGGGGGYNGGGGARLVNVGIRAGGGGGGSYNSGSSREGQSGVRTGEGEVLITLIAQPQPPANVSATPVGTNVEVCWQSPGEEDVWAEPENVYVEIRRRDCGGEQHIATVPTGGAFSGCFTDRFAPLSGSREECGVPAHECEVTYQVRYVGLVSGVANPPALVPEGFIVGYDGPLAEIPSGWTRVTALDGRYPKGASGTGLGPNGGTSTHSHTSQPHTHQMSSHRHTLPASLGSTPTASISTKRWERTPPGGGTERFSSVRGGVGSHSHPLGGLSPWFPANIITGNPEPGQTNGSAPSTSSASHEPLHRTTVWIESDGTPTSLPADSFVLGTSTPADFEQVPGIGGRYLKGAAAGSPGGGLGGSSSHTHTLNAHTHGTPSHVHASIFNRDAIFESGYQGLTSEPQYWVSLNTAAGGTRLVREAAHPDNTAPPTSFSPGDVQHTHDVQMQPSTSGTTSSNGSGNSSTAANRPVGRTLRALRSTTGAIRTGLIGLWRGDISNLPAGLTRCDGSNGTPDMRGRMVEEAGSGAPGQAVGSSTHTHTVPAHTHTLPSHSHGMTVLPFSGLTMRAVSGSATNSRSAANHTHSVGNTSAATPTVSPATAVVDPATVEPPFSEVHFVRIDAVSTSPLNEEVVQATEDGEASTTVTAPDEDMALLKHPVLDVELLACPDVTWSRTRPFEATQALQGGMPTVVVGAPGGRDYGLSFTVDEAGKDALETILSATLFWMQPARGAAGWFTASPWQVIEMKSSPSYWRVDVTVTETEPQAVPLAESLL